MLTALAVLPLHDRLACRGHRAVALENLALRQQLYALKRRIKRPTLRRRDRLFWIVLATAWRDWRIALLFVQPDTVVRWHHQWLRRRWTQRSRQTRQDWPSTAAAIRTLVDDMRAANPLWGAPRLHGELLKLGIDIGESRVSKYMVRRRTPHRRHGAGSWKTTSETCRCGFLHRADDPFPGPVCLPGACP